jgi:thiosulfate reductase cytochrome b subunit
MRRGSAKPRPIHPWPLRLMHWLNALAIVMMIGSGWQIYNASPLFGFTFPSLVTIGGWLGAGIAWHLAFMWLLVVNGLFYLLWGFGSGHFRRQFWPRPGLRFTSICRTGTGFITPCSGCFIQA